jgi:hypothetical protein
LTTAVSQVFDVSSLKYTKVGNVTFGAKFGSELKFVGYKFNIKIGGGKNQVMSTYRKGWVPEELILGTTIDATIRVRCISTRLVSAIDVAEKYC